MQLTISLGQMDVQLGDSARNLATAARLIADAARRGTDLLVLPELWSSGYDLANAAQHAAAIDAGVFAATSELARKHEVAVVGSCLSQEAGGGFANTAAFHTRTGALQAAYSKIHLFRLMDEDQYLTPGPARTLFQTDWGTFGLAICYDLRFPELFRAYALAGATAVVVPAEWPYPRVAHWRTLLRARAIENQMFVIACNRVGTSGDTTFCGRSAIIDPWGETVVEGGESEILLTATIDLAQVAAVRERIPVFADRRAELYAN